MLVPQQMRNQGTLTDVSLQIEQCLQGPDIDQLTDTLLEYFFLSYDFDNLERKKYEESIILPALKNLDLFKKWRQDNFEVFARRLISTLYNEIDEEIYFSQFFGHVYSSLDLPEKFLYFTFIDSASIKGKSAFNHIYYNYLRDSGKLLDQLGIDSNRSYVAKKNFLKDIRFETRYWQGRVSMLHNFILGVVLCLVVWNLPSVYYDSIATYVFPYLFANFVLNFGRRLLYDIYYEKNFKETFKGLLGTEKFSDPIKEVIADFLDESNNLIKNKINSLNSTSNANLLTDIRYRESSTLFVPIVKDTPVISMTSSSSNQIVSVKKNEFINASAKTSKDLPKITPQKLPGLTITWTISVDTKINFDSNVFNPKVIKLWGKINDTYFVYWDKTKVKDMIQAEMGKEANNALTTVSKAAHYGHIVAPIDHTGYVNCKKEKKGKYPLKLKIFNSGYGSYRMFFEKVAQQDRFVLLEPASFKKTH